MHKQVGFTVQRNLRPIDELNLQASLANLLENVADHVLIRKTDTTLHKLSRKLQDRHARPTIAVLRWGLLRSEIRTKMIANSWRRSTKTDYFHLLTRHVQMKMG